MAEKTDSLEPYLLELIEMEFAVGNRNVIKRIGEENLSTLT